VTKADVLRETTARELARRAALAVERARLYEAALRDRARLAYMRYNGGVSNLLEALDADRELFDAERSLAQARRDELLSVVQLYKALGGGWEMSRGKPFVPEATKKEMEERTSWGDLLSEPSGAEQEQNQPPAQR